MNSLSFTHLSVAIPTSRFCIQIIIALIISYLAARAVYTLFFSPLSSIPGPKLAAVTDLYLQYHVLRLNQCRAIQSLHERYGPVVRIGPNKVAFRDLNSMRAVYSTHKMPKSIYYKSLLTNNNDHAMSVLEHEPHAERRRGYAPHYQPSNLVAWQPEFQDSTLEALDALEQIDGKRPVDGLDFFRHLMADVIVASSFGSKLGAMAKFVAGHEDPFCSAVADFPKRGILRSVVPTFLWTTICKFPNQRFRKLCDSDRIMAELVSARVYEMRAQLSAGTIGNCEKTPMLLRLLNHKYASTGAAMPDRDMISECMGHLIAGVDTSSITLSYFFWELSRRPEIANNLQAELDDVMPDSHTIPDASVLASLPYLNAFIKEGLRLYGAAPSLLERVVASKRDEDFDLLGFALPTGTVLATQAWSMHRDTSVFPSPEAFIPERWLANGENAAQLSKMSSYLMPFGTGSRVCGGQNLAQIMLKTAVAAIARNFDIVAPRETNAESMKIVDSFVIFPAAMKAMLSFHRRRS